MIKIINFSLAFYINTFIIQVIIFLKTVKSKKMKKEIHPVEHEVKVILSDGTSFTVMSSCKSDSIKLDVDPLNHPAWKTGQGTFLNVNNDRVSKFKKKFGDVFSE
ncbi:MAG: 50S ribosomal protein L31 [Rickettsiales bacterium]|nr:50S ribosomal protein L31 [Rickettsiales bacterium]